MAVMFVCSVLQPRRSFYFGDQQGVEQSSVETNVMLLTYKVLYYFLSTFTYLTIQSSEPFLSSLHIDAALEQCGSSLVIASG